MCEHLRQVHETLPKITTYVQDALEMVREQVADNPKLQKMVDGLGNEWNANIAQVFALRALARSFLMNTPEANRMVLLHAMNAIATKRKQYTVGQFMEDVKAEC